MINETTLHVAASAAPQRLEDSWTPDQSQALQAAYFRVEPNHPYFWQEVARRVPGRTAGVGPRVCI